VLAGHSHSAGEMYTVHPVVPVVQGGNRSPAALHQLVRWQMRGARQSARRGFCGQHAVVACAWVRCDTVHLSSGRAECAAEVGAPEDLER
jgi:hypothetical protein